MTTVAQLQALGFVITPHSEGVGLTKVWHAEPFLYYRAHMVPKDQAHLYADRAPQDDGPGGSGGYAFITTDVWRLEKGNTQFPWGFIMERDIRPIEDLATKVADARRALKDAQAALTDKIEAVTIA